VSGRRVVIFGIGEFAQVARVYLTEDSPHEVVAFTVNERYVADPELDGCPVVPFERIEAEYPPGDFAMFVAIGFSRVNQARAEIYAECKRLGYELITYVSSRATTWGDLDIGENSFVFEDNVIQPFAKIGNDVVLWSGNHIGHHAVIGDHCFITSHVVVSGGTTIGAHTFIGVNATLRDHIKIGPSNVIGAGAIIMHDTDPEDVFAPKRTERSSRKSSELDL
jgi:sugar O-acyltransferase (sialic acid O-acetyltransferase NeuD family)